MTDITRLRKTYETSVQSCDGAHANLLDESSPHDQPSRLNFFRSAYGNKLKCHADWRNAVKEAEVAR
ncbi:MAG TPA: hypothetical protein VGG45_16405 [Terracidiphilus sp.]|jgi:hypothetical protein